MSQIIRRQSNEIVIDFTTFSANWARFEAMHALLRFDNVGSSMRTCLAGSSTRSTESRPRLLAKLYRCAWLAGSISCGARISAAYWEASCAVMSA